MSLWIKMADELAILCCTSATSDINTARRRFEHEGLSFLTIILPELGKSTQKWLDQGQVGTNSSFSKGRGSLPLFLGGFFSRVFDRRSGVLLDDPSIDAIFAIRQLTLSFGKISLPCSDARVRKAMEGYVECEKDVRQFDKEVSQKDLTDFRNMSNLLFREVFQQMDRDVHYGELLPKHGPGATADRLSSNGKYNQRTWTTRLDRVFPLDQHLIPNARFSGSLDEVTVLEPGDEMPVRVISVPKTLKTPRIIAVEPTCMQYMQQALLRSFLAAYQRDNLLRGLIGFDDQGPNQDLARKGSLDKGTATLDLSEASDRVSNQLVREMVSQWPLLQEAFDATRSRRADVPGVGVIRLAKYASMGSALCFPVEAMVFTTLIFLGIQKSLNTTLTKKDIKSFLGSVRVYGDDLIVPVEHVTTVVQVLEHFGARVGLDKSFWTGRFRESCGKEYFNGHDVSIVRVRQVLPYTTADATGLISTVSLRNQLFHAGLVDTAGWLDSRLTKILRYFPVVGPDSPVLGREAYLQPYQVDRMHPHLHSPQVRGYVVQAKPPVDILEGEGALLKCLLKLETGNYVREVNRYVNTVPCYLPGTSTGVRTRNLSSQLLPQLDDRTGFINFRSTSSQLPIGSNDEQHLERSGRPKRVGIKLGWYSSF
jgi:hypothetical protein